MNNKLRIPALLLAASLTLLGAGCSSASAGSSTAQIPVLPKIGGLEKTTLNVHIVPAVDSAGFFVALNEGLFAREGLKVNYTPAFSNTETIGGMARGQYDITSMDYVSYVQAQISHLANVHIFAEGSVLQPGSQVIMAMPHSGVQSLADLKGRVLGAPGANIGFLLSASTLTQDGIHLKASQGSSSSSVLLPQDPNFPFPPIQPLVSGQVAAAHLTEPFATELQEQYGAVTIADLDSGATEQFPIEGYAVTKAWAGANPNTLKAFNTALEAGQEIADTNRSAVEAAFVALKPGAGHIDPRTAALMALNNYPLGVDSVRLQRVADVMREFGLLKQRFNIEQLLS